MNLISIKVAGFHPNLSLKSTQFKNISSWVEDIIRKYWLVEELWTLIMKTQSNVDKWACFNNYRARLNKIKWGEFLLEKCPTHRFTFIIRRDLILSHYWATHWDILEMRMLDCKLGLGSLAKSYNWIVVIIKICESYMREDYAWPSTIKVKSLNEGDLMAIITKTRIH